MRSRRLANNAFELGSTLDTNGSNSRKRLLTLEQISTLPVLVLTEEDIQRSKKLATAPTIAAPPKVVSMANRASSADLHTSSQSARSSYYSVNEYPSKNQNTAEPSIAVPEPAVVGNKSPTHVDDSLANEDVQTSNKNEKDVEDDSMVNDCNEVSKSDDNSDRNSTSETDTSGASGSGSGSDENRSNDDKNSNMLHEENCAVCLDDYNSGEQVRQLPCRHFFHIACIDPWLSLRSATCPLCNFDVAATFSSEEEIDNSIP
ncbi:hypothetical protein EV178_004877 [Coemansia sp. RSA 1646]|nr:hypothetical protein EV178_004877 [Coemansia sp. RSA 1646]KAJ1765768.1 hypothetical protein LPJ74_006214 [Coemansia sp. RSA 1843]KAJ2211718.1 hypothetical protein EV179_005275 [Coemansia sp. RSA 487]